MMLDKEKIEQRVKEAVGRFEYNVNGGALIRPAYKYVYYDPSSGVPAMFMGRDTPNAMNEAGVAITLAGDRFWGDKVSLGSDVSAHYFSRAHNWDVRSGTVSGMYHHRGPGSVFEFDFIAVNGNEQRHIIGHFILEV